MKCKCGVVITEEQDKENERIAEESKTPKLDMCIVCWLEYAEHATTGN